MELIYCAILIFSFILMVFVLDLLQRYDIAQGEVTRKIGHFILGGILITMPFLFNDMVFPIVTCSIISFIIYTSSRMNKLACADCVERVTYGTFLFPIGVLATYILAQIFDKFDLFFPSIIILTISDIVAALVGKIALNLRDSWLYNLDNVLFVKFHKSISGSLAFLVSTMIILLCFIDNIFYILFIGIMITIIEFISTKGLDNITIPIGTFILLNLIF